MTLNLPLLYFVWPEEYCQTSPNKNKSPNLWHVTSILVCCIFDCAPILCNFWYLFIYLGHVQRSSFWKCSYFFSRFFCVVATLKLFFGRVKAVLLFSVLLHQNQNSTCWIFPSWYIFIIYVSNRKVYPYVCTLPVN